MSDDLRPEGLETRCPGLVSGWSGETLLHMILLVAAIGLVVGVVLGRIGAPDALRGPIINAVDIRRA